MPHTVNCALTLTILIFVTSPMLLTLATDISSSSSNSDLSSSSNRRTLQTMESLFSSHGARVRRTLRGQGFMPPASAYGMPTARPGRCSDLAHYADCFLCGKMSDEPQIYFGCCNDVPEVIEFCRALLN